ncbi:MAG: hypothetical protein ACOCVC_08105 [Spirochaeta sp.]
MVQPGETILSEQQLQEFRQKIQDETYVSQAIECIAEIMARELLPDNEQGQSPRLNHDSYTSID